MASEQIRRGSTCEVSLGLPKPGASGHLTPYIGTREPKLEPRQVIQVTRNPATFNHP